MLKLNKKLSELPDQQAEIVLNLADDFCFYMYKKLEKCNATVDIGIGITGIAVAKLLATALSSAGSSKEQAALSVDKYLENVKANVIQYMEIFEEAMRDKGN